MVTLEAIPDRNNLRKSMKWLEEQPSYKLIQSVPDGTYVSSPIWREMPYYPPAGRKDRGGHG